MQAIAQQALGIANGLRIGAGRKLARGGTVALAMLGLFAHEVHATLIRIVAYGALLATLALLAVEATTIAGVTGGKSAAKAEWMQTAETPALRGAMSNSHE